MTTAQRKKHKESINRILTDNGYTLNRYDKYEQNFGNFKLRIDTRKTSIKVERKLNIEGQDWSKVYSEPMSSLPLDRFPSIVDMWKSSGEQMYQRKCRANGIEIQSL